MHDTVGAFVPGTSVHIEGRADGPLSGLTFAAKDLFDVAGHPTGGGNHDWARDHPVPDRHAAPVQHLLDAGATLVGKSVTDEISLGILGESAFDGTPINTAAPGRVPGGSSSGSAAAVAAGLCDTAIGTDTGGSVRVPASFCGLYGIRPTHGRLDLRGMMPQAPTSDTAGWFARDATTFARVSEVLLDESIADRLPARMVVAVDALGFADPEVSDAVAPLLDRLEAVIGARGEALLAPPGLSTWARAQRTLQPYEAWLTFQAWIEAHNPRFAYSVARGLAQSAEIPASERLWATQMRREARGHLARLLEPGTVACFPTTPFPALPRGLALPDQDEPRARIACLCSHGGLTGVPQISVPGAMADGLPVGLSLIARRGDDALLVRTAIALEGSQ